MTTTLTFDAFRSRLAKSQIDVADAQQHASLQGSPGLQRAVARAAGADGFVRGDTEVRQLFGELSRWFGAPGSTPERLVMPEGAALSRAVAGLVSVAKPDATGVPAATPRPTVHAGSDGPAVKSLQTWLTLRGFDPGPQDGLFGPRTEGAVRAFQRARGLEVDGIVGPQTWGALQNSSAAAGSTRPSAPTRTAGPNTTTGGAAIHQRLLQHFSSPEGYRSVQREVRQFYPPDKDNGCVAYLSEALRQTGVPIPHKRDASGLNISTVTTPFSNHLEHRLGWQRIRSMHDLKPGDVCFTKPGPKYPDDPAHTFMFHGWQDQARGIARVVDNQENVHLRNITVDNYGEFNFTPFAYALRAPGA